MSITTYINGATHQRVSLMCFHHNLKQIRRHVLLHVKHFSHSACEVFHCLARRTAFQALIRSMQPTNISLTSHNSGNTTQHPCTVNNTNTLIITGEIKARYYCQVYHAMTCTLLLTSPHIRLPLSVWISLQIYWEDLTDPETICSFFKYKRLKWTRWVASPLKQQWCIKKVGSSVSSTTVLTVILLATMCDEKANCQLLGSL